MWLCVIINDFYYCNNDFVILYWVYLYIVLIHNTYIWYPYICIVIVPCKWDSCFLSATEGQSPLANCCFILLWHSENVLCVNIIIKTLFSRQWRPLSHGIIVIHLFSTVSTSLWLTSWSPHTSMTFKYLSQSIAWPKRMLFFTLSDRIHGSWGA